MSVVSIKCPNCGGELVFDPGSQKYKCEYCGSDFVLDEIQTNEESARQSGQQTSDVEYAGRRGTAETGAGAAAVGVAAEASSNQENADKGQPVLYTCPSCGAEVVTDETTAATFCYYCHNPVMLSGRLEGDFHPDAVLPFEISRKQAEEHFMDFVQKKKFVPNAFFQKKQIEKLAGIYFPYWVYDAKVEGDLTAEGSRIRVWRAGDEEITETRIFHLDRGGEVNIREITKHALKKSNQMLAEGVLPYDFSKARDFQMGYLSGFYAEKRDISDGELSPEVQEEVRSYAGELLIDTMQGYTGVHTLSEHYRFIEERWRYMLLPVWTVTYKGSNGKIYYYSMNGQNGKTFGELPIDRMKVFRIGLLLGAIVFAVVLMLGYFLF